MTLSTWLQSARVRLQEAGVDSAQLEAQLLAAHALDADRSWVLAHPEAPVPDTAKDLLRRRLAREPLAYILGWREFYGRRFRVTPDVLIPRHETEGVVEEALARLPPGVAARCLDVGTGSGCIGITIKLERPEAEVILSDISAAALSVAGENARALGANVTGVESDLFQAVPGSFDLIVTNPPYIGEQEPLMPEVRDFEPHSALFAGGSGMQIYRRLALEAGEKLTPNGALVMEVGFAQAQRVCDLFAEHGWRTSTSKDLSGIDRVVTARR